MNFLLTRLAFLSAFAPLLFLMACDPPNRMEDNKGITIVDNNGNPTQPDPNPPLLDSKVFDQNDHIAILTPRHPQHKQALLKLERMENKGLIPVLTDLVKLHRENTPPSILRTLKKLSGEDFGQDWHQWKEWQETQTLPGNNHYIWFKTNLLSFYDNYYQTFIRPRMMHTIPLEGVMCADSKVDAFPVLTNPATTTASKAKFLKEDDAVIGVSINGEARAYPLRILEWNDLANDVLGGQKITLSYCPYSGSPTCFDTDLGSSGVFTFGSSGLIRNGNKLIYDKTTFSLWQNIDGRCVIGPISPAKLQLKKIPSLRTSWSDWKKMHPETTVVIPVPFLRINYSANRPFEKYEKSSAMLYPVTLKQKVFKSKDTIFGIISGNISLAVNLNLFKQRNFHKVTNGKESFVVLGNADLKTAMAYEAGDNVFVKFENDSLITDAGVKWQKTEAALIGPEGKKLKRVVGQLCYWATWQAFYPDTITATQTKKNEE